MATEHEEQARFIAMVRQVPHVAARWTFAIPNGFLRTKSMRIRAWQEGVVSGILDTLTPYKSKGRSGLWIEMKRKGGKPTKEQIEFIKYAVTQDYEVALCYSAVEAFTVWCEYLGITISDSHGI